MGVSVALSITQNSQSIPANTSNVTVKVTVSWTDGSYNKNTTAPDVPVGHLTVDGTTYSKGYPFNQGATETGSETWWTWTGTIPHNADGSKTLNCSFRFISRVQPEATASASKALTLIPGLS